MADTELDEVLTRLYATGGFNLDGTSIAHKRVEPLELGEAKQKLLKLIDKEVTRSRIDELNKLNSKIAENGWHKENAYKMYPYMVDRIKTIQEEGTDNG